MQKSAPVQGFGLNVGYSTGSQTCLPLLLLMFCSGTFDAGDLPNPAADVFYDQTHGKMLSPVPSLVAKQAEGRLITVEAGN
ncbi:hypothetical protein [Mesorhizobium caraganae]|uniref:hypothetical protein n=1 Tax=Mesorhizobium caraganae TaxID=483206 RepID=UPI003ECE75A1